MKKEVRSWEGYVRFMTSVYVKKKGEGPMLSARQYESNMKQWCREMRVAEFHLHSMTKIELMQHMRKFVDLGTKVRNYGDYCSTAETYLEYVRYTLGLYQSSMRQAA